MLEEQEGEKPQLTLLPTIPAEDDTNIFADFPVYADKVACVIQRLTSAALAGAAIAPEEYMKALDAYEDNSKVRDWFVVNGLLTKSEFEKKLKSVARNKRIEDVLGFIPKSPRDFVNRYAETRQITLTNIGTLNRAFTFAVADQTITEHNRDTTPETAMIYDVAKSDNADLNALGRELRMIRDDLDLPYRDTALADALEAWQVATRRQQKVDALLHIHFEKGRATGPTGQAMWASMETACFDTTDTCPGFPTAVIKKFMWQVKRKARDMAVTNHLMPVITGAQGKGKTQFVQKMTEPLMAFRREVDFNLITDGKTTDIWSNWILFIDEMGFFKKADVDAVKNVITSETRTIRAMRQNSSNPIRNHATLIGCTNQSLAQLVRDDTGGRRFAELIYRNDPDWDALNAIDWQMMWKSVDETAGDPMADGGMMELLRDQQETNRNQSPTEIWIRTYGHSYKNWISASDLFSTYIDWEKENFRRNETNQTMFGRNLTNLITTNPDFPFEKQRDSKGMKYRYKGK